jgi:hypothetical protein
VARALRGTYHHQCGARAFITCLPPAACRPHCGGGHRAAPPQSFPAAGSGVCDGFRVPKLPPTPGNQLQFPQNLRGVFILALFVSHSIRSL